MLGNTFWLGNPKQSPTSTLELLEIPHLIMVFGDVCCIDIVCQVNSPLKIRRSDLVCFIHARFPDLADFAQQQVERFDQPAALDLLIRQVAAAPDANAVRFALNAGAQ